MSKGNFKKNTFGYWISDCLTKKQIIKKAQRKIREENKKACKEF